MKEAKLVSWVIDHIMENTAKYYWFIKDNFAIVPQGGNNFTAKEV